MVDYTRNIGEQGENLSIVIPTYNCAFYLRETLNTLQAQGDRLAKAQIEVVDDASTKDDPEAVVREVWGDRVSFYRHPKNVGACANFNACLERAERPWVHILHGDDYVLPGAYDDFATTLATCTAPVAVFGRSLFVDKDSVWLSVSDRLGPEAFGHYPYDPMPWRVCPVQFAGVLFSKEAIAQVGNFDCTFGHAQDWNLWWRIARTGKAAYTNKCVGAYRIFEGNHTSTLVKTGKNVREYLKQLSYLNKSVREDFGDAGPTEAVLYQPMFFKAYMQARDLIGDSEAFKANMEILHQFPKGAKSRTHMIRLQLAAMKIGK